MDHSVSQQKADHKAKTKGQKTSFQGKWTVGFTKQILGKGGIVVHHNISHMRLCVCLCVEYVGE